MFNIQSFKQLVTKSAQIRYAASFGYSRSQIVKLFKEHLGIEIRYQHVRNVLLQAPKKQEHKMIEADIM